jgi:hypothetical protein
LLNKKCMMHYYGKIRISIMKYLYLITIIFPFVVLYSSCIRKHESVSIGFQEPADQDTVSLVMWDEITSGLHSSFGSIDKRYSRNIPPNIDLLNVWAGTAWRGERLNAQMILWAAEDIKKIKIDANNLQGKKGNRINSSNITISLIRYVITDEFLGGCGWRNHDTIPSHLVADPFENTTSFDLPANTSRPVWITIDVPADAVPDQYRGNIIITCAEGTNIGFEINLVVQDMLLPPPSAWIYHLDLWLNPFAISRYHKVKLWTQEFWDQLRPYVVMLAQAGQKCITTCIIDDPWKSVPVYDSYKSMIKRVKKMNGQWEYDYSVFDQYVRFIQECGITGQINCFTMATWGDEYRYFDEVMYNELKASKGGKCDDDSYSDEDSSGYVIIKALPGEEDYNSFWKPFLIDFSSHLKETGWIDRTCIAMDERNPEQIKNIMTLIEEYAPDLKIAMAINRIIPELNLSIYDISSIVHNPLEASVIRERVEKGFPTTFYTCCAPPEHPNNWTFSPPADAVWLGWYAAANGYTGFLRFAYCSWTENPLMDSRYQTWPAGDCYQIYPGPRSSIRFERLREGIQDYEKIRILRDKFTAMNSQEGKTKLNELNNFLQEFTLEALDDKPSGEWVNEGNKILNMLLE